MIRTLEDVEREAILDALVHTQGNRTHAAARLGISVRTLRNKIHRYQQEGRFVPNKRHVFDPSRAGYEYE